MARETSGGRIGRTVYLPSDVWANLEELATGREKHPAFQRHQVRHGSVSGVIEHIVKWDAPKQLQTMQDRLSQAERKLLTARAAKQQAGQVAHSLQTQIAGVVAALIQLRDSDI